MFVARAINEFIDRHPTIKILALAFLILVGVALIADSLEFHIPKGYLYFSMAFAFGVEMLNLRLRSKLDEKAAAAAEPHGPGGVRRDG
jgi:predicted tellurium resistance membrane protein TerC